MATFYVSEYSSAGLPTAHGIMQTAHLHDWVQDQVKVFTGTSSQVTLSPATKFVRLHTDSVCSYRAGNPGIAGGNNPVATTSNARLATNQTEYFGVAPNSVLAVIANV